MHTVRQVVVKMVLLRLSNVIKLVIKPLNHVVVRIPGCLSRIGKPDFYPSRIPDPESKNSSKKEGEKSLLSYIFL
jgi:hypothetical protein